jgi:hypothetical protein
MATTN